MQINKKVIFCGCGALIVLVLALIQGRNAEPDGIRVSRSNDQSQRTERWRGLFGDNQSASREKDIRDTVDSESSLVDEFKKRWRQFEKLSLTVEEQDSRLALAMECFQTLGFSDDFFELEGYLDENNIIASRSGTLTAALWEIDNPELLDRLGNEFISLIARCTKGRVKTGIMNRLYITNPDGVLVASSNLQTLSTLFGNRLEDDKFEAYRSSLRDLDPVLAQEVTIHRAHKIYQTGGGVEASLGMVLEELSSDSRSQSAYRGVTGIIDWAKSSEELAVISEMLAASSLPDIDKVNAGQALMQRYAPLEPDAAFDHLIAHPNVYGEETTVNGLGAAMASVTSENGVDYALKWVSRISDAELREKVIFEAASRYFDETGEYEYQKEKDIFRMLPMHLGSEARARFYEKYGKTD